ncbi:MAG: hypothetical protein P8R54_00430 [Myxococcota bacterium]|nr:hypothetical protein [Myxococcota bacterium]
MMRIQMYLSAALLIGCSGRGDSAAEEDAAECGDIDGSGTDTGDIPNILGNWNTTFGLQIDYENCSIPGLKPDDMGWINGASLDIAGTPPSSMYAEFAGEEGEKFYGLISSHGGVVFSGIHNEFDDNQTEHELHVSFGGLLYYNDLLGINEIKGHAYMGLDSNDDGYLDCGLQGEFTAKKAGS